MLENPCKPDCPKRNSTCHTTCDEYFVYALCKDYERNLKHKEQKTNDDIWHTSRHAKKQKRGRPYGDNRGEH